MPLTPYQQLRTLRVITGYTYRLQDLEEIITIQLTPEVVFLAIRTVDARFSSGTHHVHRTGTKVVRVCRTAAGTWQPAPVLVTWDTVKSPALITARPACDWPDKEAWEVLCHRPGNSKSPMDNAKRKAQGYTYG